MNQMSSGQPGAVQDDWLEWGFRNLVDFYSGDWTLQRPIFGAAFVVTLAYALIMSVGLGRPHSQVSYECSGIVFLLLLGLPLLNRAVEEIRGGHILHGSYNVRISATREGFIMDGGVHGFIERELNSVEDFRKEFSLVWIKEFITEKELIIE